MRTRPAFRLLKTTRASRPPTPSVSLAARIAAIKREIHRLRLLAIATSVRGCVFSSAELLAQSRLDADLRFVLGPATTPKAVGRRLVQLAAQPSPGMRLVRIDRNEDGCIWMVEIQDDAGLPLDTGL